MASNDDNSSHSPMHLGLTGQFSPEDIQELLGVMGDGSDTHHHHQGDDGETSGSDGLAHLAGSTYRDSSAPATASSVPESTANNHSSSGNQEGTTNGTASDINNTSLSSSQPEDDAKAQARSERKRSREKQRRSDVNKQFADLTQLLQRIDAENITEEDVKNGTANRMTFNPSNRVDLIARTIVLLERLHEANKRRRTEISSLQQQLEEAKKAGEDTAAKLKEAMLAPPGQPANKQFMMMVPMMMSTDGTGAAVPMMNPFMPQATMPHHAYYPTPHQAMAPSVAPPSQPVPVSAPVASAPSHAPAPAVPIAPPAAAPPVAAAAAAAHSQQIQAAPQHMQPQAFPYMMAPHMPGGGYMMPFPAPGHAMPGQTMQPMAMAVPQVASQEQAGQQEQKDSSNGLSGGSNLAHCA